MQKIYLITDYNNRFGTKYTAIPYRSGMDKRLLSEELLLKGFETEFLTASEVHQRIGDPANKIFLYTSAEDSGNNYKSFLEDVILSLESRNAIVIPSYIFLRTHNNKTLMELIWKGSVASTMNSLRSYCFGSFEEFQQSKEEIKLPVVVKKPEGYKGRGVYLAQNKEELVRIIKKISRTRNLKGEIKDFLRAFKYKGFIKESYYRRKFVIQEFVPDLKNDYKVLVFGKKYYVLLRQTRKNDFRASGSGLLSYPQDLPDGLLDFCEKVFKHFNVPFISLDIAYNGTVFYLLESQFVYFGTYTLDHSEFYFVRQDKNWQKIMARSILEREFASCISEFIRTNVNEA